ncbi:hypothetical protein [Bradyrhizobium sp. sGM-13]|uniref:hypothetical protein n=1 Tax=Bradyrhizobium sp. sGM-13 TaxID=2831781 RepID=UPI001BD1AC9D|nr:hypothetical protein [Bradyrhizobium sp. sGM-13]
MPRYFPPKSISIPWKVLVLRQDPDLERDKRNEIEYQFSNGRAFRGNPATRGPYSED